MTETKLGEILDADDLFSELQQIKANMEFPCAICGTSFASHNMEILTKCFQSIPAAQSTLARELIQAVEAERLDHEKCGNNCTVCESSYDLAIDEAVDAIRAKCKELGVDVDG